MEYVRKMSGQDRTSLVSVNDNNGTCTYHHGWAELTASQEEALRWLCTDVRQVAGLNAPKVQTRMGHQNEWAHILFLYHRSQVFRPLSASWWNRLASRLLWILISYVTKIRIFGSPSYALPHSPLQKCRLFRTYGEQKLFDCWLHYIEISQF